MEPTQNKKLLIGIVVLAVIAIVGGVLYLSNKNKKPKLTPEEERIQKQVQELDALRKQIGAKKYTEKELQQQSKELDALRSGAVGPDGQAVKIVPRTLTPAEIQKQASELDALRAAKK